MATLNYTAAQIDALLAKADTAVQPATTGDLDNLATSTKTDLVSAINETFTSVSDGKTLVAAAITDKGVATAATDSFSTMATNIAAIPSGGTVEAVEKDVNFIDYDGTILYSYSKADFANLSAMPDNPTHTGLMARGWNWSLSDAQTYVAANGGLWIGQLYYDANGSTEIDIQLQAGRLAPYLGLGINGTVTIDWGDSSTADTVTGTSLTTRKATQHTYSAPGAYTIKITPTSGSFSLIGTSNYGILSNNTSGTGSRVYLSSVLAVRLGLNVAIGGYAFYYCMSLKCIVFSNTTTLSSSTSGVFQSSGINIVAFPQQLSINNLTNLFNAALVKKLTLPSSAGTIPSGAFSGSSYIAHITIPAGYSILSSSAFKNCYGLGEIHFKPSTPPTASSDTFSNLPTDCIIYVPTGKLNNYKTASYYPDPNTYTYVEE